MLRLKKSIESSLRIAIPKILEHCLGVSAKDARTRPISTGRFNSSFYVTLGCGDEYVLRIAPPDDAGFVFYEKNVMAQEPGLHKIVREQTRIPVPEIICYDPSRTLVDRDYLVMERVPGTTLSNAYVSTDKVFRQVGEYLAQLHQIRANQFGYLGEHKPMEPQDNWCDAFAVMWERMICDIQGCHGYSPKDAKRFRDLWKAYKPVFDRDTSSSLLHMDIWHENIMVDRTGKVTGIIDWDRALWGDPEIEYAVLDYCGVSESSFWQGYGRKRDTSDNAHIRQRFYLLYEVQKYIVIRALRWKDRNTANRYKSMCLSLARDL